VYTKKRAKLRSVEHFICLPASVLHAFWAQNYAACNDPVHIHTSSWRSGELRINPIALSYFQPLRNRDGYNAVRRDTDKRLARSRRHHPSVAFTPTAILRRFARLIGTAEPTQVSASLFYPRFLAKKKTSEIKRCNLDARWTHQWIIEHYYGIIQSNNCTRLILSFTYFKYVFKFINLKRNKMLILSIQLY